MHIFQLELFHTKEGLPFNFFLTANRIIECHFLQNIFVATKHLLLDARIDRNFTIHCNVNINE